jgi:peptidoglycan/LPS O-acetylase OafA/YrhL
MELEEGMVRKIAISTGAVGVFVALIVGIGVTYNDGGLGSTGGLALVASMAVFILLMAVVGLLIGD